MNEVYGSREYFERKAVIAETNEELIRQAIADRLRSGQVEPEEMILYADCLRETAQTRKIAGERLNEKLREDSENENRKTVKG